MFKKSIKRFLNVYSDDHIIPFVQEHLESISAGSRIIDIGAGSQRFRKYCSHLEYFSQDFGEASSGIGTNKENYEYGPIDYKGNCWETGAPDHSFDAVLCTEVLEHVPYPEKTIEEIARILKPGGVLILTAPLSSLRHMDPHWYQPGLSDNWYRYFFKKYKIEISCLNTIGNYNEFLYGELIRSLTYNRWAAIFLFPAIFYFKIFKSYMKSMNSLTCIGYQIAAKKSY